MKKIVENVILIPFIAVFLLSSTGILIINHTCFTYNSTNTSFFNINEDNCFHNHKEEHNCCDENICQTHDKHNKKENCCHNKTKLLKIILQLKPNNNTKIKLKTQRLFNELFSFFDIAHNLNPHFKNPLHFFYINPVPLTILHLFCNLLL